MTIKPGARKSPKSSSEDASDNDSNATVPVAPPVQAARVREGERPVRQGKRQKKARRPASHSATSSSRPRESKRSAEESGHNSSDEREHRTIEYSKELEESFHQRLRKDRGFDVKRIQGDGACLFRCVAYQVYGDEDFHSTVRESCMNHIAANREHFAPYITEDFDEYVARKRDPVCHGNNVEIQAMSEIYGRCIEVYQYSSTQPMNTFSYAISVTAPIRLSYYSWGDLGHYNLILDPEHPSTGVGLGMPNLVPGLADQPYRETLQMTDREAIENTLLKDQLSKSDCDATADIVEQYVLQQSYWDSLEAEDTNRRKRRRPSARSSASPTHASDEDELSRPLKRPSPPHSPPGSMTVQQKLKYMRTRKENMQRASYRCVPAAGRLSPSDKSSPPSGARYSPRAGASSSGRSHSSRAVPSAASGPWPSFSPPPTASGSPPRASTSASSVATSHATSSDVSASSWTHGDALLATELAKSDLLMGPGGSASNIDDVEVLASVMAASTQQYFDELKQRGARRGS